ncbi:ADP-heptose synthase, bifunctional sugar kinase/adenylyltransferase [Humidesulfovibrio mexicanus]|uniref:ADP-heptose synthase, bifunctional sugar kinase/adenylyltransferase n=1 Tax=Humidesulfovibrio mexicanus TaxID=147047 RepID=A0A239CFD0_9BACT|nr:PfkB family carbohydrate kinase [Humidesulfovibrio mexicanus]SNS18602.1 ADP-heptose synthase, bifunctional sugar kinase/adenylyltransferase [Humidesulfovibrio mexicanus]
MPVADKIIGLDEMVQRVEELKKAGRIVVQSHGVFDLIHPGIISHLNEAKGIGDVLVVTVIQDADVRRGPGRPVFPDRLRAENVASLEMVDMVAIVPEDIPFECVKRINPSFFAKGHDHKQRDKHIHDKIFETERHLYFGRTQIFETRGVSFSSTQYISNNWDGYPDETKQYLHRMAERHGFEDIAAAVNSLSGARTLIIGDGIIDEYHYCTAMGRAGKSNLVVNKYLTHERFAGGVFAIANHVACICDHVRLVTVLGQDDPDEEFVSTSLKSNIQADFFHRADGPTIIKKRYLDIHSNQKVFEVNYLNERDIDADCEDAVVRHLVEVLPEYDVVLVSDFGHGFISPRIIRTLEEHAKLLCVNTQTNAANTGFNMVTKYSAPHFICLDEPEARLAMQNRFGDITDVLQSLAAAVPAREVIITLGKKGSVGMSQGGAPRFTPIFSSRVVDTIGAGDAVFSYAAICFACGLPLELIQFIGNVVGALAVQIVCNKKSVEKHELLQFISVILQRKDPTPSGAA